MSGRARITVSAALAVCISASVARTECVRTNPATMLQFSDLVVAGELTAVRDSVDRSGDDGTEWRILTVEPIAVWKGKARQTVRILCAWDCLPAFKIGRTYLFYASRKNRENFTGRCWRNNDFEAALFDRYLLPDPVWSRELEPVAPVTTSALVALLDHPVYSVAEGAARDFLWLVDADSRVVGELVSVLRSADAVHPQLAAVALAELNAGEAIPDLQWAFDNRDPVIAIAALTALSAVDGDVGRREERILRALEHRSSTVSYQAVNLYADEALRGDGTLDPLRAIEVLKVLREGERDPDVVLRIDIRMNDLIEALE